jgi:hypothetical protein
MSLAFVYAVYILYWLFVYAIDFLFIPLAFCRQGKTKGKSLIDGCDLGFCECLCCITCAAVGYIGFYDTLCNCDYPVWTFDWNCDYPYWKFDLAIFVKFFCICF